VQIFVADCASVRVMTRLPVMQPEPDSLDTLTIATPCQVPWESLAGDDRVRHCGRCRQNVYNIESFERVEALRLIQAREGRVCLRLYRRTDGTLVTADCWSRLRAARRRGLVTFAVALVLVGWAQLWAVAVGLYGLRRVVGGRTMGTPAVGQFGPLPAPVPPPPVLPEPGFTMGAPPMAPPSP
jgi:hypothetical protein